MKGSRSDGVLNAGINLQNKKIGILILDNKINRGSRVNYFDSLPYIGLKNIIKESGLDYDIINPLECEKYPFVLISLTSTMDIENLAMTFKDSVKKGKSKIIVGGSGCINIWSIKEYIDIAVFGRADGQLNDIMDGKDFDNVWRKQIDPELEGNYIIRQVTSRYEDESIVGCRNKCLYCHYTWTRKYEGDIKIFNPIGVDEREYDWKGLNFKKGAGRYLSAIDGTSEETRFKVHKRISDQDIINKIIEIYETRREKTIGLSIFNIIGYPWETPQSLTDDFIKLGESIAKADKKTKLQGNKIQIRFQCTPFSPEPFTPMDCLGIEIKTDWRKVVEKIRRNIYRGIDILAFINPQVQMPYIRTKRIFIQRANRETAAIVHSIITNKKVDRLLKEDRFKALQSYDKTPWQLIGYQDETPVSYLSTYIKYKHMNREFKLNAE